MFSPKTGTFFPPAGAEMPQQRVLRRLTWEDTLTELSLDEDDARYGLHAQRGTWYCRRRRACDALGLPLAIRTLQRPSKGFVLQRHDHAYFGVVIEKAGLTTLNSLFTGSRMRRLGVRGWKSPEILFSPRCRNTTNGHLIDEAARVALRASESDARERLGGAGARDRPLPPSQLTACGHASSFDLDARIPTLSFAVVRDPLSRFISAHNEVGDRGLSACYGLPRVLRRALPWMNRSTDCPLIHLTVAS